MRILGIDPGLGTVGFGLVEMDPAGDRPVSWDWGVIATHKDGTNSERLAEIFQDMVGVIHHTQPDLVSLERIFYFRNATTMVPVCQARGVIMLAIEQAGLPLFEYTPMQVKQSMTGYGKAKKREVQEMVAQLLGLPDIPRPDDAADALALALTHYQFAGRGVAHGKPISRA